jgi:parallel beta-helix repeat protein
LDFGSFSNKILQNVITLNTRYGIIITRSSNNFLRYNNVTANKYNFGVYGDRLSDFIHDVDASNIVNGKPIYYWINEQNKTAPADAGYLALINCTQITVQNLQISNNCQGLLLAYTRNSTISNNSLTRNGCGLQLFNSPHNIAFKNNLTGNDVGVWFIQANNNHIMDNDLIANNDAMRLYSSSNNVIIENNIETNNLGICFWNSSSNSFHHNNFKNNTQQVYDYSWEYPEQCPSSINTWNVNYPSGGNFWSDYLGVDLYHGPYQNVTGSDGIGDTPYVIDESNQDKYPLMSPWPSIHEISIINITFSTSTPKVNDTICIYVTVQNLGHFTETFDISLNYTYLFDPLISTQTITIASGETVTLNFTWTPTANGRYEIKAYTNTVPNDINPEDNTKITYIYIGPRGSPGGSSSSSFRFHINLLV